MRPLTIDQARRVAIRAQRLDRRRSTAPLSLLRRLGAVQIDSVNVVARAHYLPFYSRSTADRASVDALFDSRRTTEYWAHEASLLSIEDRGLFAWRMRGWRDHAWGNALRVAEDYPGLLETVLEEVAAEPGTARQIESRLETDHPRDRSDWGWNWSAVKRMCEALFWAGRLSTTGRNAQFERIYTLGGVPEIDDAAAARELVRRTVRACGVANRRTIRDYFRLSPAIADLGIREALASGTIREVAVDGRPWLATADLVVPRSVGGTTLLAPFDPLLWDRERVEHLFGFRYRIEIYTPQPMRVYGYYVLPFLLGGHLRARVDLKADRKAGRLLVRGAFGPAAAGTPLARELQRLAGWLGLTSVTVADHGDLSAGLWRAL
ncbi:MAG: crosslink repair DNA glycosylase YcaQ family protein [Candidatus Nanopelagicales bacterium]